MARRIALRSPSAPGGLRATPAGAQRVGKG
ncbi:hypothetical protein Murka_0054 [Xanthomonas phage Murka]|nr:hypothetical protein Murka_0054 [Xanthomonas phage Murka]